MQENRETLYSYFVTGAKPTQSQFADLIDSCFNFVDDTIGISQITGLSAALAGKQTTLGFTPENVANKSTSTTLGTSNTQYPTQNAVKVYVDTAVSGAIAGVSSFNTRTGAVTLTSGDVTTALGFTPYNASNPSGYLTSSSSLAWANITGEPNTLAGYGITTSDTLFATTYYPYSSNPAGYLTSTGIPSQTGNSGKYLTTNGTSMSWATVSSGSTYSAGTGLTLSGTTFSVNTSQNIATLSNLTTNGAVTTSGGTGTLGITTVTATATASAIPLWDGNKNLGANSFLYGYATTASGGGNVSLTVSSAMTQFVTGTTGQTFLLPVVSTLVLGQCFEITNISTGTTTVQSSGANTICTLTNGQTAILTCIATTGTGTAAWSYYIVGSSTVSLTNANTWSAEQTFSASGTAVNVTNGNIAVPNGNVTSSGIYASYKTGMAYAINTGGSTYGGIGNTSTNNQYALGTNTAGPQNAFTTWAAYWNTTNFMPVSPVYKLIAAAINSTATATAAQMGGGYITSTSVAATTITFTTATLLATQLLITAAGFVFPMWIDNSAGASTVTVALGTGMTQIGSPSLTISAGSQPALFHFVFTSATACGVSRIY